MKIESGRVVTLTLTITAEDGKVLERFDINKPTAYLHGHDQLAAGVEADLEGKEVGHTFELTMPDAFGEAGTTEPQPVPKREFPKTWKLEAGMAFFANGTEGNQVRLFVHAVKGSRVYVSNTHPWAGQAITFSGEVLAVRNATESERAHGHAHGPGGHHH